MEATGFFETLATMKLYGFPFQMTAILIFNAVRISGVGFTQLLQPIM
jgi:hypothetical protein